MPSGLKSRATGVACVALLCFACAKPAPVQSAKLVDLSWKKITKSRFVGEPFGNVHFMTSRPYQAILYKMTLESEAGREEVCYEAKSRRDDLTDLQVGDAVEIRKTGKGADLKGKGNKTWKVRPCGD